MKVLVTGGAGFIGHNVVRILESQGHECIVIDTCTDYGFIPKDELTYLVDNRLKRINTQIRKIDIRESTFVDTIFKTYQPDVVIHMASFPRQKVVEQNPVLASDVMSNGLINLLEKSKQPRVIIKNESFPWENKLVWRKLKITSPQINKEIKPHNYKNYPKYLLKPNFGWQAIGIELYNELPDNINNYCFIEEFIPSKLIDNHCYSIRVIVIVNKKDFYPILYSNRKCLNSIVKNLKGDKLSDKDRFSYISNINSDNQDYIINNDIRLKEFVSNLKFLT
jgi:hypothetical protein